MARFVPQGSLSARHRNGAAARYLRASRPRSGDQDSDVAPLYGLPPLEALVPVPEGAAAAAPDLLHPQPCRSIDGDAALRALEFAFAAGDSAGVATGALEGAALSPSEFEPANFERELFIDELIGGCMAFRIEGKAAPLARHHLKRLLCRPPSDPAIAAFRGRIIEELRAEPRLVTALQGVYRHVARLLSLFDESAGQSRYAMPRWRLDVLGELRALFDSMHGPFGAASSGLKRLHTFAEQVRSGKGYGELCALLDFEGDMAQADLRLRIGVDGKVRQLEVMEQREHRTEPFYRGPLSRMLWRVMMFMRGYQVGDTELVERWFDHVYTGVVEYLPAVLQLRGDLEFYLAACHFADRAEQKGLSVCLPSWTEGAADEHKQVEGLFNPLLLAESRPPVPCTLDADSFRRCCIVTGPNSGGKTRLLQAVALCQLLGQAGFVVPARSARLRRAPGMFVSLGEEASADQKEGRLGTELMRIRRLFESALPRSLVVLDELCSGTNPSEGEEIFHLVVELLRELEPEVYITTHFLSFAAQLARESEELALCFLQVELDGHSMPTYQFVPGVASTSLAKQTAARLGVTRDELLALMRKRRP